MTTKAQAIPRRWCVEYSYNGGRGAMTVVAETEAEARGIVLAEATPQWASDPSTPVQVDAAYRIMRYRELDALPRRGLKRAVERTWQRKDYGHEFLVVQRGNLTDDGLLAYTDTGLIVGNTTTRSKGDALVRKLTEKHRELMCTIYDVVPRNSVEIIESGAAIGCVMGQ